MAGAKGIKVDHKDIRSKKILKKMAEYEKPELQLVVIDESAKDTEDSLGVLKECNTNLLDAINQLDQYMNIIAETFSEIDTVVSKKIEGIVLPLNNNYSGMLD